MQLLAAEEKIQTMTTDINVQKRRIDFEESHAFDNIKVLRRDIDNEHVEVRMEVPAMRNVHVHLVVVPYIYLEA